MRTLLSWRTASFLVLCLGLLAGGCRKAAPSSGTGGRAAPAAAPSGLDGVWKAVSQEVDGQPLPKEYVENNPAVLEIAGNRWTLKVGNRVFGEGTVQVDTSRQPHTIDMSGGMVAGGKAGQSGSGQGIYEVSGDTLKVCQARPDKPRPTSFQTRPGDGHTLTVYRRVR